MKRAFIFLAILLILPTILAVNLDVTKISSDEVMVLGLEQPTNFDVEITNNGNSDSFKIYSFFGTNFEPKESIKISKGETKDLTLSVYPSYDMTQTGHTTFEYFIQGSDDSEQTEQLLVKIVKLENAFSISAGEIDTASNTIEFYIKNKENYNFEDLDVKFSSAFFDLEDSFSLGPYEMKKFHVTLNSADFRKMTAGFYTITATIKTGDLEAQTDGVIKFEEKDLITTNSDSYGFLIRTNVIEKSNEGNTISGVQTIVKKDIISRLFTSFSPEPTSVNREGNGVYYTWAKELKPGESLKVTTRTNWFLPFLTIILIVAIVVFVKQYNQTNLKLRKKITFIKSKGGQFALKVSIFVDAKANLENVRVIDRLPPLVNLYNKFGREQPAKVDETNKRLEWKFEKLGAGEKRILNYIVYSKKVGVLGKFAIPTTVAFFERDGKMKESESNKVFFMAETAE